MKKTTHKLILSLGACFVVTLVAPLVKASSTSKLPKTLQIQCSSAQIGTLAMTLSNPTQLTISDAIGYYDVDLQRYDSNGQLVSSEVFKIDKSGKHQDPARLYLKEEVGSVYQEDTLALNIPALEVNWQEHQERCYAKSPAPGIDLILGIRTQTINSQYSNPLVNLFRTNPDVTNEFVYEPISAYPVVIETLRGKRCPNVEKSVRTSAPIRCVVVSAL